MFGRIALVYDESCSLCRKSLTLLKRFDVIRRIELIDFNDAGTLSARFPAALGLDFDKAMYAVDERGLFHRGFYAFRIAMLSCPLLIVPAALLFIPGIPFAGSRVYGFVAERRHSLGCGSTCAPTRTP